MVKIYAFIIAVSTISAAMGGCASQTKQSVAYQPPAPLADLAAPCADLPLIEQGDAQTVALWIVDTVERYHDCKSRHAGMVRAWPGQSFGASVKAY